MIGALKEIAQNFKSFGPIVSIPMALEQSRELRMVNISCSEHETTLSFGERNIEEI